MASERIKFPLNSKAVAAADQKFWADHKDLNGRRLTSSDPKALKDAWKEAYRKALSEIEKPPAPPADSPPPIVGTCPPKGHLEVRVTTCSNDQPVKGAIVNAFGLGAITTGDDGLADYGEVTAGSYYITAEKDDALAGRPSTASASANVPANASIVVTLKLLLPAKLKENLDACDGGSGAWDAAKKAIGKDPHVQIGPTASGFGAETDSSTGTITIKPATDCSTATEFLLFELHNVESTPNFATVDADAAAGKLSREDYTRAQEHIEYDGIQRNLTAFNKCKSTWGFSPGAKSYFDAFSSAKDFDDFYQHYENPKHEDWYRTSWDNNYKAAYTKNHP